jgi:hypothetical protein
MPVQVKTQVAEGDATLKEARALVTRYKALCTKKLEEVGEPVGGAGLEEEEEEELMPMCSVIEGRASRLPRHGPCSQPPGQGYITVP